MVFEVRYFFIDGTEAVESIEEHGITEDDVTLFITDEIFRKHGYRIIRGDGDKPTTVVTLNGLKYLRVKIANQ